MDKDKLVLLIEDEPALSKILQEALLDRGYRVDVAVHGEEGWQKTKELEPDLVLLDIILPRLDGFVYLKRLRNTKHLKKTPVIILSNLGQDADVAEGKELGALDYLVKSNHTIAAIIKRIDKVFA
ncbi:MAG: two-component response regulator [uncultured bacterium]|nr:MAG: two-component response regulator [uncultured bacterium]